MKTLLKRQEEYRVETETGVQELIEKMKQDKGFELISYSSTNKQKKTSNANPDGDSYYIVKFKMEYNKENEPKYSDAI